MEEREDGIKVWNRKTKSYFYEEVPAEGFLRYLYTVESKGSNVVRTIARLPALSHLFGFIQKLPLSKRAIEPFVKKYKISLDECPHKNFHSFNDFFTRKIHKHARPLAKTELIGPVDGRYLCFEDISLADGIYAKGQKLSLEELLGDPVLAEIYQGGSLVIARLAPVDYHRMHMPTGGKLTMPKSIPGKLDSVSPFAIRNKIEIYSQNKRIVIEADSDHLGKFLYIPVGATYVGSIRLGYTPEIALAKGDEIGLFEFGGSTVILLFERGRVAFDPDLIEQTKLGYETYLHMGESLGKRIQKKTS